MFNTQKHKGFTLIELLVVIAIVGLLATLAMVALQNAREKSRDARRKGDLKQVYTALDLYLTGPGNGLYPDETISLECFTDCTTLIAELITANNLMAALPQEPLSNDGWCYRYASEDGTDYKITAQLESDDDLMLNDGGVHDGWYEIFTPGAQTW